MHPFALLALAIVSEMMATVSLKLSNGFTRPLPSLVVVLGYGFSFYMLSLSLRRIPLGVAYAIWSGVGTAGMVVIGYLLWQEQLDAPRIAGIVLIILGVLLLNLFTTPSH